MRGMKAQGISRDTLPFKAPLQPYLSYIALGFTVVLSLIKGFDAFINPFDYKTFITNYIG
jgi:amino acid transporter